MSTITHDQTAFATGDRQINVTMLDQIKAWNRRRQTIARVTRELNTYSNRQLADLGLSRGDIPDVARGRITR